eukprot:TRINITY_DN4584_c0_g1_i1.p1 TRINITY_DN4584_c0_g1~~TRINITY_DN4584_c0_g1_i1.p1  ORF type:complete len:821 (-),score=143.59 TRINITY_DN4584_c0_g1_i1:62-2524(-)
MCIALALAHEKTPEGNCILVFFAGIQDIEDALEEFNSLPLESERLFQFAILHSEMEHDDCLSVFTPIPCGITRVILSTNIAESSVTLPGVRYVFDFGTHKQVVHSPEFNCDMLQKKIISKSSAQQRKGRTGRLFPGNVFRFYSRALFEKMASFEEPEILRVSLSSAVLRLKSNFHKSQILGDIEQILSDTMVSPDPRSVSSAFEDLLDLGALVFRDPTARQNSHKDTLPSPLGVFLSTLAIDMKLGRMIAHGLLFEKILPHLIVIASFSSLPTPFMKPIPLQMATSKEEYNERISTVEAARIKLDGGLQSDSFAFLRIFAGSVRTKNLADYCFTNRLVMRRLRVILAKIREITQSVIKSLPSSFPVMKDLHKLLQVIGGQIDKDFLGRFNLDTSCAEVDLQTLRLVFGICLSQNILQTPPGRLKIKPLRPTLDQHGFDPSLNEDTTILCSLSQPVAQKELQQKLKRSLQSDHFKLVAPSLPETSEETENDVSKKKKRERTKKKEKTLQIAISFPPGSHDQSHKEKTLFVKQPVTMRSFLALSRKGEICLDSIVGPPTDAKLTIANNPNPPQPQEAAKDIIISSIHSVYPALNWILRAARVRIQGPLKTLALEKAYALNYYEKATFSPRIYAVASHLIQAGNTLFAENITILNSPLMKEKTSQPFVSLLLLIISAVEEGLTTPLVQTMIDPATGRQWIIATNPQSQSPRQSPRQSQGQSYPLPSALSPRALPIVTQFMKSYQSTWDAIFFGTNSLALVWKKLGHQKLLEPLFRFEEYMSYVDTHRLHSVLTENDQKEKERKKRDKKKEKKRQDDENVENSQ